MYVVCNMDGDEISGKWATQEEAIAEGREALENDPELRELHVWRVAGLDECVRTITFAPDAHWDTVVVDLAPGERITLPVGPVEPDEGAEAYEPDSPKHPDYHAVYSEIHDSKDGL